MLCHLYTNNFMALTYYFTWQENPIQLPKVPTYVRLLIIFYFSFCMIQIIQGRVIVELTEHQSSLQSM